MVELVKLREVVVKSTGSKNPEKEPNENFIYVDVSAVDNATKSINESKEILGSSAPSRARKLIRSGDVLVSTIRPNLNAVALVPPELDGQVASTGFCVLRATEKALPEYIYYFSRSKVFVDNLTSLVAGAMYPAVTDTQVLDQSLPLPSISDQRRIVDLLSRAEGIVCLRREAEKKAAELIPALFIDMFGDPASNPKRWKTRPFGELVKNKDGKRKPIKSADRLNHQGQYPYYGASGIIDTYDNYIFDGEHLLIAEDGANLLSRSTPIAFLATGKYWVNNHAHVVGENGLANLTYLECALNLRDLRDFVTGSAQPKLNQANLNMIPIANCPLDLQRKFADHVEQIRSIQSEQFSATVKAKAAFDALLSQVFT